jgi:hypothetical protein
MIVARGLEDFVDGDFAVAAARFERLRYLVKQQHPGRLPGRHDGDLPVPDEGAQLVGKVGGDTAQARFHLTIMALRADYGDLRNGACSGTAIFPGFAMF